jgi:uracil-DNA glycosylase
MRLMAGKFEQLLEATIKYLEDLKASGVEQVSLGPGALGRLAQPPAQSASSSASGLGAARPELTAAPPSETKAQAAAKPAPASGPAEFTFPGPPLAGDARTQAMAELRTRAMVCVKCPHLAGSRRNVVFGVGDIHSPLMFVGEAPGAEEDEQGEPFVGKAGQLLTRIIKTMGFSRNTVYIANILKCRPDTPGQVTGNRKPTTEEMKTCLPYLLAQIDLIQPKVIVALGATAMEGLFGKPVPITKARGQFQLFRNIPVMPTFHPAYLLRNQALSEKRKVWEDMLRVLEKLGLPVSEKQRSYFLRA